MQHIATTKHAFMNETHISDAAAKGHIAICQQSQSSHSAMHVAIAIYRQHPTLTTPHPHVAMHAATAICQQTQQRQSLYDVACVCACMCKRTLALCLLMHCVTLCLFISVLVITMSQTPRRLPPACRRLPPACLLRWHPQCHCCKAGGGPSVRGASQRTAQVPAL